MAPSWSTCDPLSCFFNPPPLPPPSVLLLLPAYPTVRACNESDCSAAAYRDAASDNGPGYESTIPLGISLGFSYGLRLRFRFRLRFPFPFLSVAFDSEGSEELQFTLKSLNTHCKGRRGGQQEGCSSGGGGKMASAVAGRHF